MLKLGLLLGFVSLAVSGPSASRSRVDIEAFRSFLEKSRTGNGFRLSERMLANPLASAWENSGKFEGDIVLDDWQIEGMVQEYAAGRNAYTWPNSKWPRNTVVYEFAPGQLNDRQQEAVMVAIRDIERNTCVRFRVRHAGEFNYVRITSAPDGCYANVGYWFSRGPHILNLAEGCYHHTVIVHEWLHIIGFFHMQSTYNRDDYVRINWENIERGMEHNFERYETNIVQNLGLPYEYTSCMHYGPYFFSINGRPTIVALRSFEGVMGQQDYITFYDWLRVRRHYNCPGAWSKSDDETQILAEEKVNVVDNTPEDTYTNN
ncbi:unnamed protein product, partial [Iphiclides podalirius]